ncbi:MAG TPA: prolyl oligopeptidase family serine peptidase, partial [Candidatus Binataceae bacterium]|nr:prolyl oligopeptidase family serine peptidase [Candidatus Binataceae bacterium]
MSTAVAFALALGGCRKEPNPGNTPAVPRTAQAAPVKPPAKHATTEPFTYEIALGPNHYQIEGYVVKSPDNGKLPAVLVLNGDEGDARQCVSKNGDLATILGIQVACVSIPGYGKSSGPSRLVGPQAVEAARHALDLLAQRDDVDPNRLAVWGVADGAVAAGLLMDYDKRPKSLILQSGAYDMVKLWPEAPLRTKLRMLHEVWPSKRVLRERSVIANLPDKLDCNVLIMHGERDQHTPLQQAQKLADELRARGAHVETEYFPRGSHDIAKQAKQPAENFLRDTIGEPQPAPAS